MNNIMDIINIPFGYVLSFCYNIFNNYGFAIIAFTLVVKLVLFPIGMKQKKSFVKQIKLRPKEEAIRKKYPNNKDKQSTEVMALYQKEGFNPLGGCLPVLLQFPIILALYQIVQKPLEYIMHLPMDTIKLLAERLSVNQASQNFQAELADKMARNFDKISDIVTKNQLINFDFLFGAQLSQTPDFTQPSILWLIPIFAGVAALLAGIYSMKSVPQAGAGNNSMKIMMYTMPLFSLWLGFSVPAGIGLYWGASSAFGILQEFILNVKYKPFEVLRQAEAEAAISNRKKKKAAVATVTEDGEVIEEQPKQKRISDQQPKKKAASKEPKESFVDNLPNVIISYKFEDDPAVIEQIKAHNERIRAAEDAEELKEELEETEETEESTEPVVDAAADKENREPLDEEDKKID